MQFPGADGIDTCGAELLQNFNDEQLRAATMLASLF
jgi:hypothetical protein